MTDHSSHEQDAAPSSDRSFGWVMAAFFALVGFWPMWSGGRVRSSAVVISLSFAALSVFRPVLLNPLNIAWHKFGLALGKIVGPLVMGALFFIVITPLGALRRVTGSDPLRRRRRPPGDSYWIPRQKSDSGTMRDQF